MKAALKRLVSGKNAQNRWLWLWPVYASIRNLRRYPVRRFVRLLRYLSRIWLGGCEPLRLDRGLKTSVFYLCLANDGRQRSVIKIPRLDNRHAHAFAQAIKEPGALEQYAALLEGLHRDPIVGVHCPRVLKLDSDGGYESAFVDGHNLRVLRDRILNLRDLPDGLVARPLLEAIAELRRSLKRLALERQSAAGDWALHNLIHETRTATIKNVDLEGFFTYGAGRMEAALDFILAELGTLETLINLAEEDSVRARSTLEVLSTVREAATSDVSYSGRAYTAGYHSLTIDGHYFRGQRECAARLAQVPFDFAGKIALDLGCNTGGMLHCLAGELKQGVGLDLDPRCIQAAKMVRDINGHRNLEFQTLDLDRDLSRIPELLATRSPDICFLLSVCMWLDRPERVIQWTSRASPALLFETNGSPSQQESQVRLVRERYAKVELVSPDSPDDPGQGKRALYLCANRVASLS